MNPAYIGRFAPSPTGPLHFGSLLAALVSYCHAHTKGGRWLVRMEDLDPPREMPGASSMILKQLENHGLEWDGDVLFQSTRLPAYRDIVEQLLGEKSAYLCVCSRKEVQAMGGRYDGRCRHRGDIDPQDAAVRIHVADTDSVVYDDIFQGLQESRPGLEGGDIVIRRRDGLYAYQLAVVVDDIEQGITHVIRGTDLQEATPRQIWLCRHLGAEPPQFGHIPVATNKFNQKLSKQNHAASLDMFTPATNLRAALSWLGIEGAPDSSQPADLVSYALAHWNSFQLKGQQNRRAPTDYQ